MASLKKNKLATRWSALKTERASWWTHWRDISSYVMPRNGRFFVQDRNRGEQRTNAIYDNTATRAVRVLAAGMMSGMTSPARPWFKLAISDDKLMQDTDVKIWLADATTEMHNVFNHSNVYRVLHMMYEELGAFGTASCILLPDFKTIVHAYPLTTGEYALAVNWKGEVDTLYREFQRTVEETVGEFGIDKVSSAVRSMFANGNIDAKVTIIHCIEPRSARDAKKVDAANMAWKSVYFELTDNDGEYLREAGFKQFPALCPRWSTAGGDTYGGSPAMEALGDIKQLQHEQLRKAQAVDYQTNPPLQVPVSMKHKAVDRLPGGISYVDQNAPHQGIRSAFEVNLDINGLLVDIQDVRHRIDASFYADLFLMISNQNNPNMTATEVAERHEEKLLMLGPVLERLQNELLSSLINITFDHMMEAGVLPTPPEALQGQDIKVELVSMLAQAQRSVGNNSIDRFVGNLGAIAQYKPEVLDKFDADQWADIYSSALGIDPSLIADDETVAQLREQRAQAQAQAQQAAEMNQHADTAKKLASANTGDKNALTDATAAFSGYT